MVNLRFNFKMDLVDISTIEFAFADSYAELETNPFLTKSFPEDGEHSQRSIILTLSAEEAELLPEQFYALATVNFKNGETIKAHAFKNTAKEEALSAALALEDTEFNINFFIDEVSGGGSGVDAYINGVKLEGYKTAAELDLVKASDTIKIWEAVLDDNDEISTDPEDYPGVKREDIAILTGAPYSQVQMWKQMQEPDNNTVYWITISTDKLRFHTGAEAPPTTKEYGDTTYQVGDFYFQDDQTIYVLIESINPTALNWVVLAGSASNQYKIYKAVFNQNNELSRLQTDYPGIQTGDLIIDRTHMGNSVTPFIWQVTFLPDNINMSIRYVANNQKVCEESTPPVSGTTMDNWKQGDIIQAKDSKFYKCLNVTTNQGEASYTWQEQILVPKPTTNDAGKVLKVNASGEPEWVAE